MHLGGARAIPVIRSDRGTGGLLSAREQNSPTGVEVRPPDSGTSRASAREVLPIGDLLAAAADHFLGPGSGAAFRTLDPSRTPAAGGPGGRPVGHVRDRRLLAAIEDAAAYGDHAEVLRLAGVLCRREPRTPDGFVWRASALAELDERAEAVGAVEQAARAGLPPAERDRLLAEILADTADPADPAGCADPADITGPADTTDPARLDAPPTPSAAAEDRARALAGRAVCLLLLDRLDEALADADAAVATAAPAEAFAVRARIRRARGDLPGAAADAERAGGPARAGAAACDTHREPDPS